MKVKIDFRYDKGTPSPPIEMDVKEISFEFQRSLDTDAIHDIGVTLGGLTQFGVDRVTISSEEAKEEEQEPQLFECSCGETFDLGKGVEESMRHIQENPDHRLRKKETEG